MADDKGAKPSSLPLKTSFKVENKLGAFYTGGKVQFSSDGEHCFCTCGNRIEVLQTQTGRTINSIYEDDDEITSFVLSKNDEILITASRSNMLRQWNWKENKVTRKWKALHNSPVISMAFDVTSTLLATGSTDNTIKVWDIIKQYCTHNLRGSQGIVHLVEFHPDPNKLLLFSSASDSKIRIWDLTTSTCISSLEGHFSPVTSLSFVEDNQFMISAGRDKVVIFWDLATRSSMKTIPVYESIESVMSLPNDIDYQWCKKPDGVKTMFITVGEKGLMRAWSFPAGKCLYSQKPIAVPVESEDSKSESTSQVAAVIQGMINEVLGCLITVTFDHNIVLHDLASLKQSKQFVGHYDEILDVKFVGEDESLLAVATNSSDVKLINRETMDCRILNGHTETVMSLDASFDGKFIASCSKDNSLRVWKLQDDGSFCCVAVGIGHTHAVGAVSWPKNSTSHVITGSRDFTLKLWNMPEIFKENVITKLSAHWTTKAHDKDINTVTFAPNDKFVASGSQDKTAKLWLASDGSLFGSLRGHKRGIWCVAFSPVDKCLATASADSTIKIWAIQDLTCVKTLEGHTNSVLKIQFITRGMQLVSSGSDGLIKIWNIKTNECLTTLDEHVDKVWSLAVNKKGDSLVTGGGDSVLNMWKDVTEEERQLEEAKQDDLILKEQELSNLLEQKKYLKAVGLAITLDRPFRVLAIFKDLLDGKDAQKLIYKVIEGLREDQIDSLLKVMCDWNTNAKHSYATQSVLAVVLKRKPIDGLMEMSNMKDSIEALIPYTERHFNRLDRLLQQSAFLDYTWQSMKLTSFQDDSPVTSTDTLNPSAVDSATDKTAEDDPATTPMASDATVTTADADNADEDMVKEDVHKEDMVKENSTSDVGKTEESTADEDISEKENVMKETKQNKIVTGQDQHEVTKKSKKKRKSIVSVVKTNKKSKKIAN